MDHTPTLTAGKDLAAFDYVLVETRTIKGKIPSQWERTGKVCDFDWFKQCIVSLNSMDDWIRSDKQITGGALPPSFSV
jgi:hypothetical protein